MTEMMVISLGEFHAEYHPPGEQEVGQVEGMYLDWDSQISVQVFNPYFVNSLAYGDPTKVKVE